MRVGRQLELLRRHRPGNDVDDDDDEHDKGYTEHIIALQTGSRYVGYVHIWPSRYRDTVPLILCGRLGDGFCVCRWAVCCCLGGARLFGWRIFTMHRTIWESSDDIHAEVIWKIGLLV